LSAEQVPQYSGQTINCTKCQQSFTVPNLTATAAPPVAPHAPIPSQHVPYGRPGPYTGGEPQQSNGWALASLILGICGCLGITGLLAIIFGIVGLTKTKDPRVGGKSMAITGIILGSVFLIVGPCMISILLPSLNRAREQANRIKCAANMRQIGQAIQIYANTNKGAFPPNLDALLTNGSLSGAEFACPSDSIAPQTGMTTLTPGTNLSYVYVGQGKNYAAASNVVILYEPMTNHANDGMNMLFADTHVEWFPRVQAQKMIAEVEAGQNPPPSGPRQ
jgi:prepilin-type processing-associated H-X9-DG protein